MAELNIGERSAKDVVERDPALVGPEHSVSR